MGSACLERSCLLASFVLVFCVSIIRADDNIEDVVRTLKGQVNALLERRQEDFRILEESIRHSLNSNSEVADLRREVDNLRHQLESLNGGTKETINQKKNDHLTIQWMSTAISELRGELSELSSMFNTSADLQQKQELSTGLDLLRGDVASFRRDLEELRAEQQQTIVTLGQLKQDVELSIQNSQNAVLMFSEHKTEVETIKNETILNSKSVSKLSRELRKMEKKFHSVSYNDDDNYLHHGVTLNTPKESKYRHNRVLRQQLIQLEHSNRELKTQQSYLEKTVHKLQNEVTTHGSYQGVKTNLPLLDRLEKIENEARKTSKHVFNITRKVSDLERLHISMLQLLESVETLENKVDRNVPEFQREISKMEFNLAQLNSDVAILKEEQENQRGSIKALGTSVQKLENHYQVDHGHLSTIEVQIQNITLLGNTSTEVEDEKKQDSRISALEEHLVESLTTTLSPLNNESTLAELIQSLSKIQMEYKQIVRHLPHDCSSIQGPNGIYPISPGEGSPLLVACDMATSPGGWTTVQRRIDGSQEFNRKWKEYADGFGTPSGEFWLGNEALHRLTGDNCSALKIEITDIYGKAWEANYEQFSVATMQDGYRLHVSGYSGNASNALEYQNNMQFSAVDSDRDISNTHCAENYEGGWWFSHCQHANLNGKYNLGLTWFDESRNEWIAVAFSEMKVRRRNLCETSAVTT